MHDDLRATSIVQESSLQRFFGQQFGAARWTTLHNALRMPTHHVALLNPFAESAVVKTALENTHGELVPLSWVSVNCVSAVNKTSERPFPRPERDINNLYNYYLLDAASMMAVEALNVQSGNDVLDMCAAPGGKSLGIAFRLFAHHADVDRDSVEYGSLTSNEPASDRNERLRQVLFSHTPIELHPRIHIMNKNGAALSSYSPHRFHRVLIDAPCSSERHVLNDNEELRKWTVKRMAQMAKLQVTLLWSALGCLRLEGGTAVYATCSLSQLENDDVVKKVLQKMVKLRGKSSSKRQSSSLLTRNSNADNTFTLSNDLDDNDSEMSANNKWWLTSDVSIVQRKWPLGEPTKYGWILLPDQANGWGPLYFCILKLTPRL